MSPAEAMSARVDGATFHLPLRPTVCTPGAARPTVAGCEEPRGVVVPGLILLTVRHAAAAAAGELDIARLGVSSLDGGTGILAGEYKSGS